MKSRIAIGIAMMVCAAMPVIAHEMAPHDMPHMSHEPAKAAVLQQPAAAIPDIPVRDQNGKQLRFYSDLVRGRTVAIDFIYTSCTTICPMQTSNFRMVQEKLAARIGKDVELISISIDPVTDTSAKLKEFSALFDPGPGWTFVTGALPDIAKLLDKLGQPLGRPEEHAAVVLIHNDKAGGWTRVDGNDPDIVSDALIGAAGPATRADATRPDAIKLDASDAARAYMQNPVLVTQDGREVHFFDDLLRGKIVMINFVLTTCKDTCPMVTANLAQVQNLLGDKVGGAINMISLSVDPQHDHPAELKAFAENFGVKPGWYFLTGAQPEIDPLLRRLAAYTVDPLDHSTIVILGNVETGVWTKTFGMAEPAVIARAVLALQSTK
jgi:cytochrome oxidase Cu insertion factor (SCO1/SenC/PrrC family)